MFNKTIIISVPLYICCVLITGCIGNNNYNLTDNSGEVFYNSSSAPAGVMITDGDTITTGINSFAVLSSDKNRIFLFPESVIVTADADDRSYSIPSGEAVFINNNRGSVNIKNDSMQLKIAGRSTLSIFRSGNYFEICVIRNGAEFLSGGKKMTLAVGAKSVIYGDKILSSKPLGMMEINKLQSMSGISNAGDLKRFYIKRDNLPDVKLVNLYLNKGALKLIKTRSGKVIVGSMTVTGNSAVIETENGELKLKTGDILTVQSYDKF